MSDTGIETRLVYGFLEAGKTTYIQECIQNDFFHKYGTTLILAFERGEVEYNEEALLEKRTSVAYYDGKEDIGTFCTRNLEAYHPDRIYVEMNTMIQDLKERLPSSLRIVSAVTRIEWQTLALYFANFRQMIGRMIADSQQVTFCGCPSRELLSPYSESFRLMNPKASYLRQDPMGYHEKAFDLFLPFSLDDPVITITSDNYILLWLDAFDHPEHYEGKILQFTDPLELRRSAYGEPWRAGRIVMTCCMADLQFMSFELDHTEPDTEEGWISFEASARVVTDAYGQKSLNLMPHRIRYVPVPKSLILNIPS